MDPLITADSQLLVGVDALLDAGGDKDETVRNSITASLCRLAKQYPCEVLRCACLYHQRNPKITISHLLVLLKAIEKICQEQVNMLDDITTKELIEFGVEGMTHLKEYVPEVQLSASNVLVAIAEKDISQVMENMMKKFQEKVVPHYTLLHTLANLANVNVPVFVSYIKPLFNHLLPLFPLIKFDSIRQVFAFALGRFCETILEYQSSASTPTDGGDIYSFSREIVAEDIYTAFETISVSWIQAREAKIVESCVLALGPMFAVLNKDKLGEQTGRLINILLGLYRRGNLIPAYSITQCLATVLHVAPPAALEPQLDSLLACLGNMVVITPDYTNPLVVKNHSEVLRCYDRLASHFQEKVTEHLLKHLNSSSDRDKVEGLVVTNHLLSGAENSLQPRIADFITVLRSLLPLPSIKVKKVLVRTVVSLICRGVADDGSDFIEFVVKHCCPQNHQGSDWDDLQSMCNNSVYLLSSTVTGVENLMWAVLQRLLLIPEYDAACPTIARSLSNLTQKLMNINKDENNSNNNYIVPPPEAVFARVLAFLGSPLHGNRGPHLLNFLLHFSKTINDDLDPIWSHKIPQLINYLEVSEWSDDEWEALLLEFVTTTLQSINVEEWTVRFGSQLSSQLPLYSAATPDERGTVLKCLALASCHISDKQIVSSHLDVILSPLRSHTLVDSKACARATGIMSRKHLNLILSRLDSLSHTELNRKTSRLLGFMKDNRTDTVIECARITLLRCYASVAAESNPSHFLPRIEDGLMQWLMVQLNAVKDNTGKEAALHMLCNIAEAVNRNREVYRENLKSRSEILAILLTRIEVSTVPDALLLRATAALVKLPPPLSSEARTTLLKAAFGKVFPAENGTALDEKSVNTSNILTYLGMLVEEILLSSVNPATLDEIATLLEPWLQKTSVQQRIASITTLRTALSAYLQNMKFTYDAPSKFSQSGQMLGHIVVRCMDTDSEVRKPSLVCAKLILLITAKYEGLSSITNNEIDEKFASLLSLETSDIADDLALVIANKLPHFQFNHFVMSMIDGLTDHENSSSAGSAKVLILFFTKKGGELYHHISEILSHLLAQLSSVNPENRPIAIQALLALARHHAKAVISTLLSQPLPFSQSVCECWRGLVNDSSLAADVLDQFLRLGSNTPFIEEVSSKSNRPPVATHLPLAAISALKEMFGMPAMHDLAVSRFAEVFTLYLNILVLYIGVSPPVSTPVSVGKMKFIPNREAYKISPPKVVQESFHSFLVCANCNSSADALNQLVNHEYDSGYSAFLKMMPLLVTSICATVGHTLPRILTCFSPYFNAKSDAQRIAFIAFYAESIGLQCGGQSALLDTVINTVMSGLNDSSPHVRRISLKGLAYISHLEEGQRERHCEPVLAALMEGLDDQDMSCHSDIALQAMTGLSQVLPTVRQEHIQNIQVAIALRIKPFFEKELSVCLRLTSLRLLGELAYYGGTAMPAFQEQVRSNLVCLLMHLSETDSSVVKACKFTLRSISPILEAERVAGMLTKHLIDDGNLQYQDFITALAKHLVEEMPDHVSAMVLTALPYSKSVWPEIRGNSALFIGLLYSNSPQEIRGHISVESVTSRLLQLLKDPEKEVRCKASHALSILFLS